MLVFKRKWKHIAYTKHINVPASFQSGEQDFKWCLLGPQLGPILSQTLMWININIFWVDGVLERLQVKKLIKAHPFRRFLGLGKERKQRAHEREKKKKQTKNKKHKPKEIDFTWPESRRSHVVIQQMLPFRVSIKFIQILYYLCGVNVRKIRLRSGSFQWEISFNVILCEWGSNILGQMR